MVSDQIFILKTRTLNCSQNYSQFRISAAYIFSKESERIKLCWFTQKCFQKIVNDVEKEKTDNF